MIIKYFQTILFMEDFIQIKPKTETKVKLKPKKRYIFSEWIFSLVNLKLNLFVFFFIKHDYKILKFND